MVEYKYHHIQGNIISLSYYEGNLKFQTKLQSIAPIKTIVLNVLKSLKTVNIYIHLYDKVSKTKGEKHY